MNLIKDPWLPVVRRDGTKDTIAIWQILDNYDKNPVIDIEAPRPDFRNAIYQLLIGITQVAAMPEDEECWRDLWDKPYSENEFKKKIFFYADCFEIDSEGPAFMQDYELTKYSEESLRNIFIDLPANEHFNKDVPQKVDIFWGAIALYSLQTFGPAGGRGQRTGLRGGGPLTTLIWPEYVNSIASTLWHKIWINTISDEYSDILTGDKKKKSKADIFPWMKPTKISSENGSGLYPQECHPFHMFFGMPRRIRLVFSKEKGICDVSGVKSTSLVTSYKTYHSGNNYSGAWIHPLNPYRNDLQKLDEAPYSIKGQPGGIIYRYWPRLALYSGSETEIVAPVVRVSQVSRVRRKNLESNFISIWAAGYDLSNMKARCWYETVMPMYSLAIDEAKELENILNSFIHFASECSSTIIFRIKEAWYKNPKEVSGDFSHISTAFWQNTENDFYNILSRLAQDVFDKRNISECVADWQRIIRNQTISLFETWALSGQEEGMDMKRVIQARNGLLKAIRFNTDKYMNNLIGK